MDFARENGILSKMQTATERRGGGYKSEGWVTVVAQTLNAAAAPPLLVVDLVSHNPKDHLVLLIRMVINLRQS